MLPTAQLAARREIVPQCVRLCRRPNGPQLKLAVLHAMEYAAKAARNLFDSEAPKASPRDSARLESEESADEPGAIGVG